MQFTLCSPNTRAHTHSFTHAKHRLAVVTCWPSNRCCEQCESQATPALLCCSTSSLVQSPTSRPREPQFHASPLPQPGHLSAWPLSEPNSPSASRRLHLVSSAQRPNYRATTHTQTHAHSGKLAIVVRAQAVNSFEHIHTLSHVTCYSTWFSTECVDV